ncbi:MAG: hypothetical protein V4683_13905 [Bacteroidota bacterium]
MNKTRKLIQQYLINSKKNKLISISIYNLFQTDIWKSKNSMVFFGSFSSFEKANKAANDLELYAFETDVVILEVGLDEVFEQ